MIVLTDAQKKEWAVIEKEYTDSGIQELAKIKELEKAVSKEDFNKVYSDYTATHGKFLEKSKIKEDFIKKNVIPQIS